MSRKQDLTEDMYAMLNERELIKAEMLTLREELEQLEFFLSGVNQDISVLEVLLAEEEWESDEGPHQ